MSLLVLQGATGPSGLKGSGGEMGPMVSPLDTVWPQPDLGLISEPFLLSSLVFPRVSTQGPPGLPGSPGQNGQIGKRVSSFCLYGVYLLNSDIQDASLSSVFLGSARCRRWPRRSWRRGSKGEAELTSPHGFSVHLATPLLPLDFPSSFVTFSSGRERL